MAAGAAAAGMEVVGMEVLHGGGCMEVMVSTEFMVSTSGFHGGRGRSERGALK